MESDNRFMRRAVALARKGGGWVNPNPLVGAVLVREGEIVGEGYHEYFGAPHAEVNAIHNAGKKAAGATMFVTLEPCSHHGKTPPCTDLILQSGIRKVVIGTLDPNPLVNGKGMKILKDKGLEVTSGCLEEEIRKMNEPFNKFILTGLPFCVLKTAMSLDGKIATSSGESRWISGEASRNYSHGLRNRYSSIMAGINTVILDDPSLNTRISGKNQHHPLKVIVDTFARIPLEAKVLKDNPQLTILAVSPEADKEKTKEIERLGAQVLVCPMKNNRIDLTFLTRSLGSMGIDSILLEGGSTLAFNALQEEVVDKVICMIAPKIIGGENAKTPVGGAGIAHLADAFRLDHLTVKRLKEDIIIEGYIIKNPNSENLCLPE